MSLHRLLIATATVGATLLAAVPAGAISITFDDTLPNDAVSITWSDAPRAGAVVSGTGCTGTLTGASGTATCSELGTIIFDSDILSRHQGAAIGAANIWEDHVGGTVSDRLLIGASTVDAANNIYHYRFEFDSNIEGSPLVAFLPQAFPDNYFDWVEADGPFVLHDERPVPGIPNTLTIVSDVETVPEPATLLMLGSGIALGAARRFKRTSRR